MSAALRLTIWHRSFQEIPAKQLLKVPLALGIRPAVTSREPFLPLSTVSFSVCEFLHETGRTYHAYHAGIGMVHPAIVSNSRPDLQHILFLLTLDKKLFRAPIRQEIRRVLDVGTGTGIWAMDFADAFPSAEVIGFDLSPIQPTMVPPNCKFVVDDFEQDWLHNKPFDYIHTRAISTAVKDWPHFLQQAYTNLKPGGWLELQEPTYPLGCTNKSLTGGESSLMRWSNFFTDAAGKFGFDAEAPHGLEPELRKAGFTEIYAKNYKWPIGTWAKGQEMKELGRYGVKNFREWLPSSSLALFKRHSDWSAESV
ncbi:S-adenosyl-L-methionine-dependent methyltransferase [Massariosphaeria phaeospora]|uniref:S-adenosyl-L-methionine-dependent methyltransferase n=1 Tax=Massariosphaeria phaeospora TaxID=100035 RepID=A0A7C8I7S2_9PLEO|nr:S-adenosyl-L-methionine-dependent methyltransferase [Massariosphaeria phaeospora]